MEGRLQEPDAWKLSFGDAGEQRFHQCPADLLVLNSRIDGNRAKARHCGTLVEAVAADNSTVKLRHDAVEARVSEHHGQNLYADFGLRQVRWKIVGLCDRFERFIAYSPARRGIFGLCSADSRRRWFRD